MKNKIITAGTFIFILIVWWISSKYVNELFVPDPVKVFEDLVLMICNGKIFIHMVYTFRRITIAAALSGILAIPCGLAIHNFEIPRYTIHPIVSLMRYVPVTAFYPLLMMWFGIDEMMKVSFLFIASFTYMMPSVILSLEEVPDDLMEAGMALGMTKLQRIIYIQLTHALPGILNSFVMCFGIGYTYAAVAETINAKYGLGYMIQQASSRGKTDIVFLGIFAIMIISFAFDNISKAAIKKLFKWRYQE